MLYILLFAAFVFAQSQNVVQTTFGPVFSTEYNGYVTSYRSIPYAAPPVGDNRFRAPVDPEPWVSPLDVTAQPPKCAQMKLLDGVYSGSEDCLYLQVYVPDSCAHQACPVFFWIHGGGWIMGHSHLNGLYDGNRIAREENMVVVAVNYRLGALGHLALNELRAEDEYASVGNMALQDQRHAMRWVRDNISNFNGDPNRVTIVGQSAGAFSVCWHLASPHSRGLFRGAIIQSGTCDAPQFFRDVDAAVSFSELYAKAVGCTSDSPNGILSCLRDLSTNDVLVSLLDMLDPDWPNNMKDGVAQNNETLERLEHYLNIVGVDIETFADNLPPLMPLMPWASVIDHSPAGLYDTPLSVIEKDRPDIPLLVGTTKDEGTMFLLLFPFMYRDVSFPPTANDIVSIMEGAFNMYPSDLVRNLTQRVLLPAYNEPSDLVSDFARANNLVTDGFFGAASRRVVSVLSNTTSTYLYRFDYDVQWPLAVMGLGSFHACELPLVFKNESPPSEVFSDNDWIISDAMSAYWGNFVHHLDPNGDGSNPLDKTPVYWPQHGSSRGIKRSLELNIPFNITTNVLANKYDAWDTFFALLDDFKK